MFTNRIYCFGDGYATGHIWPEWPQILEALLPNFKIINISGIGSGPEWLVTRCIQSISEMPHSLVCWQWPQADRFDKLIESSDWQTLINKDPVYFFNTYSNCGQTWWLSSASDNTKVQQYHCEFIQPLQHQQRLENYQILIKNTLENLNCQSVFFSVSDEECFSKQPRFVHTRLNEIQPSPIVHFYYCIEKLLPALKLTSTNIKKLETLITTQQWQAYDPDREEIWQEIKTKLNLPKR